MLLETREKCHALVSLINIIHFQSHGKSKIFSPILKDWLKNKLKYNFNEKSRFSNKTLTPKP